LRDELADAEAFVGYRLGPEDTAGARRLRLVQAFSAGADGMDLEALPPGCVLCNVRGHEETIAEWVLMAALAVHRRLLVLDQELRKGVWRRRWDELQIESDLGERTLGTVGFGAIGARVAQLASCLGMRTLAVTRHPSDERAAGVERLAALTELRWLFEESDVAVVCLPLRPETNGLIGRPELEALGADGILVNVARGPIVQERALFEALRDRRLGGAALDVWYRYPERSEDWVPLATQPFWELDNVVLSPHASGSSGSTRRRRWEFVAEQLGRLAAGEPLENVLETGRRRR
jgi:phosphoglycerate dehydrogenase-like enzyme